MVLSRNYWMNKINRQSANPCKLVLKPACVCVCLDCINLKLYPCGSQSVRDVSVTTASRCACVAVGKLFITHRRSIAKRGGCFQRRLFVCWPDCKPEGSLFSAEFVCLPVYVCVCVCVCVCACVWPALLPFNVDRFWRNLVKRTLLWSSLAATIMVQIGRSGTARRLFENFNKFSKITEIEFQSSGPSFFASVSPAYCKKIRLDSNKTDGEDTFWSLPLSP